MAEKANGNQILGEVKLPLLWKEGFKSHLDISAWRRERASHIALVESHAIHIIILWSEFLMFPQYEVGLYFFS